MTRTRFDPDELAALESERDFLLRSLDDLEAERAAGNLDDDRYDSLKDDYTARAAAVLRAIEAGVDTRPAPPPIPWRRKIAVGAGLAGFAVLSAVLLAGALGQRLPGTTVTGNQQLSTDQGEVLERRVRENPDDPRAHLDYARYLIANNRPAEAVKEFDEVARLDPTNAEAPAYAGWIVFLAGRANETASPGEDARVPADVSAQLTDAALRRLDAAVAADPDYADAHFFRGMVLLRGKNDAAGAVPEFERYLALAPEGTQTQQVRALLELARSQSRGE